MYIVKDYQISRLAKKKLVKPRQCSSWQQLCFGGLSFWPVPKAYVIVYFGSNLTLSHTWILFTFIFFTGNYKILFGYTCVLARLVFISVD